MKKFIVLYHAPESFSKQAQNSSPEEMKKSMNAWMAWAKKMDKKLIDFGTPLGNGQKITKSGSANSTREVVGYSILEANSLDEAKKLLKGHPHLDMPGGCEIEVHEALPVPGM